MSYVLRVSLTFIVDYEGVRCSCQVAIISHCQVKLVQCWGGACHMQSTDYQYWTSLILQLNISGTTATIQYSMKQVKNKNIVSNTFGPLTTISGRKFCSVLTFASQKPIWILYSTHEN